MANAIYCQMYWDIQVSDSVCVYVSICVGTLGLLPVGGVGALGFLQRGGGGGGGGVGPLQVGENSDWAPHM